MYLPRDFRSGAVAVMLFVSVLGARCDGDERSGRTACEPHQTIVFYDQSASNVVEPATKARFRETLAMLSDSALACKGDGVHGFLVHGSTTAKAERVDVTDTLSPPVTKGSKSTKALAQARFDAALQLQRDRADTLLLGLPAASVNPAFRSHTDLLGTLEVISDEVGPGQSATVYYFSDMRESMAPRGRNFDSNPPKDVAQARQWADADAAALADKPVKRDRLHNVEVRIMMGNLAAKPNAGEVRAYWERLFERAGIESVRYNS
jgi:hypothetical protein